jgi:hypothetical protein
VFLHGEVHFFLDPGGKLRCGLLRQAVPLVAVTGPFTQMELFEPRPVLRARPNDVFGLDERL